MCGIAGLVNFNGLPPELASARVSAALARLAPRGPDGNGVLSDGFCAFGHCRLAVIDLSETAAQPMSAHDAVITFNGEIYNHDELRRELAAKGFVFRTRSDTEVLLAGWRAWGSGLLPRLLGMFAFALWDPRARELVLVRDRFGKKPLFFSHADDRASFASDFLALEMAAGKTFPLDSRALRALFTLRFIPEPMTIGSGARKVPPGHYIRIRKGSIETHRWYRMPAPGKAPSSRDEAAEMLSDIFDAAVRDRLVGDVPIGAFLSSGVDSATVVASMARSAGRVRTFTIGFEGASDYFEERPAARLISNHLGTDHVELTIPAAAAAEAVGEVFERLDEPFGDSSAVPAFLVARETRRHVTVALTGDGADELFGGYRKYVGEAWAGSYGSLPAPVRWAIRTIAASLPESKDAPLLEKFRRLRRFVAYADKPPAARQAGWLRMLTEAELDSLFVPPSAPADLEETIHRLREEYGEADPLNAMLYADLAFGLPADMLLKVDRMSMAHGLEARCPFLDHRIVEYGAALPGHWKIGRIVGKKILRQAFGNRLPPSIMRQPKKGFELPVSAWLKGPLAEKISHACDPARLRRQGIFDPAQPGQWLADLKTGRRDTSGALWTLLAFQEWARIHHRAESVP